MKNRSRTPHRLLHTFSAALIAGALTLATGCESMSGDENKEASLVPATSTPDFLTWNFYGLTAIENNAPTPLSALDDSYEGPAVVSGTIFDVCEKKGCWMVLQDGDRSVRVRFKDYSFFVPRNSKEHRVVVEGECTVETLSVDTLRHYAEDGGASQEEIDAITEPETTQTIMATAVYIQGDDLDEPHSQ